MDIPRPPTSCFFPHDVDLEVSTHSSGPVFHPETFFEGPGAWRGPESPTTPPPRRDSPTRFVGFWFSSHPRHPRPSVTPSPPQLSTAQRTAH
eukprot:3967231-Pyramimonas_sp.AAC.1